MKYIIGVVGLLIFSIIYKAAINYSYLSRLRALRNAHREYISNLGKDEYDGWAFTKRIPEAKGLIMKSGISDQSLSWMEPVGFGHIQPKSMSVLDNMAYLNIEVQGKLIDMFYRAEGVYEARCREALSLAYWAEIILHLPAYALTYLGLPAGSFWGRLFNIVAWVSGVLGFFTSLPDFSGLQAMVSGWLAILKTPF